jgi:tetratricopeptide (TPR) repeat protein/pimeloyl-ACP methyl ester carboxylesterase
MQLKTQQKPDSEGLHPICDAENPQRRADIVFVHGLSGGSHGTWQSGNNGENGYFSWLDGLAEDLPDCGVWTLGYAAGITHWFGAPGMAIQDRARNLVLKLLNKQIGQRPLVFVTHSMGGLEVKEIIVRSQTCGSPDWKHLVASVRGVVFCGTPHRGAHLATAAGILANYLRTQEHLRQMKMGAPMLDTLHEEFLAWQRATAVKVESYVERVGLFRTRWWRRPLPLGLVVPVESGNPGIVGCDCHPIAADHITLVKPNGRDHEVYGGVLRFIRGALSPRPKEVTITVKLPDDFKTFSEQKKQEFRLFLAREANVNPDEILIGEPRSGSTKIDLQISEVAAKRILEKFNAEQSALRDRGIIKLDATMPQRLVSLRRLGTADWAFVGRDAELAHMNGLLEQGGVRVATLVAAGGVGKTTLVAKWLSLLAAQEWAGFEVVFDWSFYSQGTREQAAPSSDLFLKEALTFFGNDGDKSFAASSAGSFEKGQRLARLVGQQRSLLILDGLEPLQYSPTSPTAGELKDQGIAAFLKGLAVSNNQSLCVITTRYRIPELKAFQETTAVEIPLQHLSQESGVALLRSLNVEGTREELETLVTDTRGHALSLKLMGSYLSYAHGGDLRRRDAIKLVVADAEEQGGHARRIMDAYVKLFEDEGEHGKRALGLFRLLGLFDRPAVADCLRVLWQAPAIAGLSEPLIGLSEDQLNLTLQRLENAKLISAHRDGAGTLLALDAHPLLREYFAQWMLAEQPNAWCAAHRRIYEYLVASAPEREQPTLEDLQPLYQAVSHGCQAGLSQEALDKIFFARIQRFDSAYSIRKLGAVASDLGAIACFFDIPWSQISQKLSDGDKAWLFNSAAFYLRTLGRLGEALEPMRASIKSYVGRGDWRNSAQAASNLSELELTLGELARAVEDAEQSVSYADRSGEFFVRTTFRATHATTLHQAGRRAQAERRFREAEQLQAERQPDYPLLYSLQGFNYCDLLLAPTERAAWQTTQKPQVRSQTSELVSACRTVSQRAAQTLKWVTEGNLGLLSIALDHLTLGRVALHASILDPKNSDLPTAISEINAAVAGLRRAGQQDYLPLGLLTRAWLRFLDGTPNGAEGAQEDLDEAWEIAERGRMKLHVADIHLHRARLFFREVKYPWESPRKDLDAAEKFINQCGYHRRDEELADAKVAIVFTTHHP